MTFKVMPEVQLRVDSAYPGDQGGGKARLDPETMLLLKISPGDLGRLKGNAGRLPRSGVRLSRTGTSARYGLIILPASTPVSASVTQSGSVSYTHLTLPTNRE